MIDRSKCYEILGVGAGVSREELKAAYRDLTKVWHPDRFAHDPRLQAKAQEKLKEINDAFDQLTSKAKRRPIIPRHDAVAEPYRERREHRRSTAAQQGYWRGMLIAVLMFGLMFFFTLRSIRRSQEQVQLATTESTAAVENEERSDRDQAERDELSRGKHRIKEPSEAQESIPRQTIGSDGTALQPVATATVTIDPLTGMVARRECPTKRTMTYPKGNEPSEYCNVHKPLPPLQAEPERASRIKSVTKRLVSPSKW
jgi:curved DNA-binding protein CbpA